MRPWAGSFPDSKRHTESADLLAMWIDNRCSGLLCKNRLSIVRRPQSERLSAVSTNESAENAVCRPTILKCLSIASGGDNLLLGQGTVRESDG